MKTFRLHLIRHGLTQANLDGIYVGSGTDPELCEEGRRALQELRARFTYPAPSTVFCSPLARAVQTADILFPTAEKKLIVPDLREMAFGCWEGRPVRELVHEPDFARWMDPSHPFTPEGAEPAADFHARCARTLMGLFEYLIKAGVSEAACVTHGGVIMSMLAQKALPQHKPEDWMADPGCGYTVLCDAAMWMRDGLVEAVEVLPLGYLDEQEKE